METPSWKRIYSNDPRKHLIVKALKKASSCTKITCVQETQAKDGLYFRGRCLKAVPKANSRGVTYNDMGVFEISDRVAFPQPVVPQFNASKFEAELIRKIAVRAVAVCAEAGITYDRLTCVMDLDACHSNGTPLDLAKLLDAPAFDFNHDILGIRRHMDRETGKLKDFFSPRCSLRIPSTERIDS